MLYDLYAQNVISCDFIQKTEILQCQTCTCQLSVMTVSVIQWLLYRHICSSEVFGDFDKEGVLHSSCTGGGVDFFQKMYNILVAVITSGFEFHPV